ncbi:predicted protein [Botrytis cinerea T4]|uniref:Uncharacterized protein n=1 Tax=Botryotinia fuckeliana (strain T4) TaxID=999810 RepID=G2YHE8_BOTF4|nr:predicted protein [Botrytis cinerea T4]
MASKMQKKQRTPKREIDFYPVDISQKKHYSLEGLHRRIKEH